MNITTTELLNISIAYYNNILAGGPGSGRHKTGRKEKDKGRQSRALSTYKPATVEKQRQAENNEKKLANALRGAVQIGDNRPFDVIVAKARIAFEVKTKIDGKKDTITMHPESRMRKEKAIKEMKLKAAFTVIFDDRHGKIYYGEGVKSFRIKLRSGADNPNLKEVKDLKELRKLL